MTTDKFFFTLKQKAATKRPFEVWVGSLGLGRGTVKKHCLTAQYEDMSQMHALGNIWRDLCDFGTFLSDFSDFRMQNHSVLSNE